MENDYQWHGKPPTKEQADIALSELCNIESKLKDGYMKEKMKKGKIILV